MDAANDPENLVDPSGRIVLAPFVVSGFVGAFTGMAQAVIEHGWDWREIEKAGAVGAIAGLIPGVSFTKLFANPLVRNAVVGASAGMLSSAASQYLLKGRVCLTQVPTSGAFGVAGLAAGGTAFWRVLWSPGGNWLMADIAESLTAGLTWGFCDILATALEGR